MCGLYHCQELMQLILSGGTPVLVCIGLLWVFTPSFLLPIVNNSYQRYSAWQFNERCSPYHHKKDDDYVAFNYPKSDEVSSQRVKYV